MKEGYLDLIGKSLWVFRTNSFYLYKIKDVFSSSCFIFLSVETIIGYPIGFTSVSFELGDFFKLYSDKAIAIRNSYTDCNSFCTISEEIAIDYINAHNIE